MSVKVKKWTRSKKKGWEVDIVVRLPTGDGKKIKRERRRVDVRTKELAKLWGQQREHEILYPTPQEPQEPQDITVQAYGEEWIEGRPGQGVVTAADEARRLRLHAWPLLGSVMLKELRPHHVRDMVHALKEKSSRRGGSLAPRTVRHVYGTLHTMLEDAVVDERISFNPCKLKRGVLPKKIDKDPEWRRTAVFGRDEAERLISDPLVPHDRRVWNALLFLTGLRFGEAAALRWAHYDAATEPLGKLSIEVTWNADAGTEGSTKTECPRAVPVHPTLAKILAAWRLSGWQSYFGRAPKPGDLIAPNREGEHRNPRRALVFFHADCEALGLRPRRQHDARRTFTSLARSDGARPDILDWITHGPSSEIIDVYTTLPFDVLCTEVLKLRLDLREGNVIALYPRAPGTPSGTAEAGTQKGAG